MSGGGASLQDAVDRLVARVLHWTPTRWGRPAASGDGSRADAVYALTQDLADAAADLEGRPRRRVPRLANDLALPDQLRVLTADVLAAGRPPPAALTRRVRDTAAAID